MTMRFGLACLLLGIAACGDDAGAPDAAADVMVDLASDMNIDARPDAILDAVPDMIPDAILDAVPDADVMPPKCEPMRALGARDLVVHEIDFNKQEVTLFNAGPSDVVASMSQISLCLGIGAYESIISAGGGAVIPKDGYGVIALSVFSNDPIEGAFGIYKYNRDWVTENLLDWLCWGPNLPDGATRHDQAMESGKWVGDCIPTPTNGIITRKRVSAGTSSADYDGTGEALQCAE